MGQLKVSPQRQIKLQAIKVGDKVKRWIFGIQMELLVGEVSDSIIKCISLDGKITLKDGWVFSRLTGAEIDEERGWDETETGSYIQV
jgi:hypothetical protein